MAYNPGKAAKAVAGAVAAGSAFLSQALLDGSVTANEGLGLVLSVLATFGVVYVVPNVRKDGDYTV